MTDTATAVEDQPKPPSKQAEVLTAKTLGGLKIVDTGDVDPWINLLIYGESGIGKTVLAGSSCVVPELAPVLFLNIEGGTLSLRRRYPEVETVRVQTFSDVVRAYDALRQGGHGYRTVVIDSLTEAQKFSMYGIMKVAKEKDSDRDPDLPGIGEWGKNIEQIRKLVRLFRDLPMNTIFTALSMTEKNKRGNELTKPLMSGKLSSEVAGFLDVVLYMYKKDVQGEGTKRILLTQSTEEVVAKDRTDNLPKYVQEPTMADLYRMMFPNADEQAA